MNSRKLTLYRCVNVTEDVFIQKFERKLNIRYHMHDNNSSDLVCFSQYTKRKRNGFFPFIPYAP